METNADQMAGNVVIIAKAKVALLANFKDSFLLNTKAPLESVPNTPNIKFLRPFYHNPNQISNPAPSRQLSFSRLITHNPKNRICQGRAAARSFQP